MINRTNWKNLKAFLKYRKEVDQISEKSLHLEKIWLLHTLRWADENHFKKAPSIRPTFPEYILSARLDGGNDKLSTNYVSHVIRSSRRFFRWLSLHRKGYASLTPAWLDTIKIPRLPEVQKEHEFVTIEEVRAIAQAPVRTLRERRIRATAVFWFLSAIRIGAFITLPIKAVDIENRAIKQWPSLGVETKFRKSATTYLLDITDLLEVVKEWDTEVRSVLPGNSFWFAHASPETGEFDLNISKAGKHRDQRARKDLRGWLDIVGLPYRSPHTFRHGHAVYAIKRAETIADLKAISQNLMHDNLKTTDGIYGILSNDDVRNKIAKLGKETEVTTNTGRNEMIELLEQVLGQLRKE